MFQICVFCVILIVHRIDAQCTITHQLKFVFEIRIFIISNLKRKCRYYFFRNFLHTIILWVIYICVLCSVMYIVNDLLWCNLGLILNIHSKNAKKKLFLFRFFSLIKYVFPFHPQIMCTTWTNFLFPSIIRTIIFVNRLSVTVDSSITNKTIV